MSRIEQLIKFLKDTPNDPFLHYAIAQEHNKAGNKELALEKYQELVDKFPNYVGTYYHLGKTQIEIGQKTEAMTTFETGIKIAQEIKDQHSLAELQSARLELLYDED